MKKEDNKGQITIFIIAGIIIVFLFIFLFLIINQKTTEDEIKNVPVELQPVKVYVDQCIKQTAISGLYLLGTQGGYIFPPNSSLVTNFSTIAFGYSRNKDVLIGIPNMEKELSDYMTLAVPSCINFSIFNQEGFNISGGYIKSNTKINQNDVVFNVEYPIKITKDQSSIQINRFIQTIPIRLGHISLIAKDIISKTIENPEWIDLTYLSSFDVDVNLVPFSSDTIIYSIQDNKTTSTPYLFMYAAKFIVNQPPKLNMPNYFELQDGKPFLYKINVSDNEEDDLLFSDNTAMFDISQEGVILFVPEVPGEFNVKIRVEDGHMNYDEKEVLFVIKE